MKKCYTKFPSSISFLASAHVIAGAITEVTADLTTTPAESVPVIMYVIMLMINPKTASPAKI